MVVFVLVDDLYKKVAPKSVKHRPNINKAILNDSEIITIAPCGEIIGIDSEKAWYSFVKKNYSHLFPKMCDRSQFNRTRRNLMQVINLIFIQLAKTFKDNILIVDSFPLEVCKFGRAKFCKTFRDEGATYSYNTEFAHKIFNFLIYPHNKLIKLPKMRRKAPDFRRGDISRKKIIAIKKNIKYNNKKNFDES